MGVWVDERLNFIYKCTYFSHLSRIVATSQTKKTYDELVEYFCPPGN